MQSALGRANTVIECHRVKLVTVGYWKQCPSFKGKAKDVTETACQAQSCVSLFMFCFVFLITLSKVAYLGKILNILHILLKILLLDNAASE